MFFTRALPSCLLLLSAERRPLFFTVPNRLLIDLRDVEAVSTLFSCLFKILG